MWSCYKNIDVQILPINTILKNYLKHLHKHKHVQILPINTILKNTGLATEKERLVQILPINTILKNYIDIYHLKLEFKSYQ